MNVSNIVNVIGTFISYLNNALIYCKIVNTKFKKGFLYFLMLLAMSILNVYVVLKLPIVIKPIYNLICLIISFYAARKDSLKSLTYYVFVLWLFGIMLDIFFMSFFTPIFKRVLALLPNVGILLISLLLQVVLYLLFRIKRLRRFVLKIKEKLDSIHNVVWLFILIVFLVVLFGIFAFKNLSSLSTVVLFTFLLIISLILSIFLLKILYEEKTFKITIDNLLENNKYYIESNAENRVFRHNIIHNLNGLKSTVSKEAAKIIDDLILEYNLRSDLGKSGDLLPNGINGIISRIVYGKKRKKINMVVSNFLQSDLFDVLTPRNYNRLCETLGVCLDNALSACEESIDRILQIVIIEDNNYIIIKIMNTFKNSLEIDKLGELNYTTKKKGHGLGLYSLFGKKDLAIKTSIINDLFESQIKIKKIKTSYDLWGFYSYYNNSCGHSGSSKI